MKLKVFPSSRQRNPAHSAGEQGFSLIEVTIALAIFSVGLLGVVSMQSVSLKNKTFSHGLSQAMREVNQSEAERLLSLSMSDAELVAGNHGPATSADGKYSTVYTVTDNTPVAGLKQVVIATSWNDFKGTHSATLTFAKDSTL